MELATFKKIVDTLKNQSEVESQLNKLNVNLINYSEPYFLIIEMLIKEIYGQGGYDWFTWFVYETPKDMSKDNPSAWDVDDNPICYDAESLWEYLEMFNKK